MATTRAEHLAWCKRRALEALEQGDLVEAVASMGSDMSKHPQTDSPSLDILIEIGLDSVTRGDAVGVRRWIEGFN